MKTWSSNKLTGTYIYCGHNQIPSGTPSTVKMEASALIVRVITEKNRSNNRT